MKEIVDKYYVFTLVYIVLSVALYVFKADPNIANMIIGAMIGILTAPTLKERGDT